MSRKVNRAPLALTIDGEVLLNMAELDLRRTPRALLDAALEQRGAVFIGVKLTRAELAQFSRDLGLLLPNLTVLLVGPRNRKKRRAQPR